MKCFSRTKINVLMVLILYLLFPPKAYAYLDPGTGSFIVQIAIASLVGIGFSVKMFWGNLKMFFYNLTAKKNKDETIECDKKEEIEDNGQTNN